MHQMITLLKKKFFFQRTVIFMKLHLNIYAKLLKFQEKIGLKIKIFDAYRPVYVQKKLWEFLPNPEFIAPPDKGSPHSRGIAIDITLVDQEENELEMGTGFDEFSKLSYHGNINISEKSYHNRLLLLGIMIDAGWDFLEMNGGTINYSTLNLILLYMIWINEEFCLFFIFLFWL